MKISPKIILESLPGVEKFILRVYFGSVIHAAKPPVGAQTSAQPTDFARFTLLPAMCSAKLGKSIAFYEDYPRSRAVHDCRVG